MVIITDGHENQSSDYKGEEGRKKLKERIEMLEGEGNWTFTFLGANIDVQQVGSVGLSMSFGNVASFDATAEGVSESSSSISCSTSSYYASRRAGKTQVKDFYNKGGSTSDDTTQGQTLKGQTSGGGNS